MELWFYVFVALYRFCATVYGYELWAIGFGFFFLWVYKLMGLGVYGLVGYWTPKL